MLHSGITGTCHWLLARQQSELCAGAVTLGADVVICHLDLVTDVSVRAGDVVTF